MELKDRMARSHRLALAELEACHCELALAPATLLVEPSADSKAAASSNANTGHADAVTALKRCVRATRNSTQLARVRVGSVAATASQVTTGSDWPNNLVVNEDYWAVDCFHSPVGLISAVSFGV